ncbi:MAG: hypothetical protein CK424_01625 [Legionella sp.]|nr:MAG: hypothetical protein CK424_01625 [Legionella sp.]
MDKDDVPSDSKKETTSTPKAHTVLWGTLSLSLLAIMLSIYAVVAHQRTVLPLQDLNQKNLVQQQRDDIQHLNNKINEMARATQSLSQKMDANEQTIKTLLKNASQPTHDQDWQIKTVRYYLGLAQINSEWTQNISATIALLKHADSLLAQIPNVTLLKTRQAIAQDIQALEQRPVIDVNSLLNKIKIIQKQIDTLNEVPADTLINKSQTPSPIASTWREQLQKNLQQLRGLVAIHHQDDAFQLQFGPQYVIFLREQIRLELQQAKMGLMTHQQMMYDASLESALNVICKGFDRNAPKTQAIIHAIQSLQKIDIVQNKIVLSDYMHLLDHETAISQDETPS